MIGCDGPKCKIDWYHLKYIKLSTIRLTTRNEYE